MNGTQTYRGRVITDADVAFIRQLIADHPTLSRRALSQKLCEAWHWVQPNGHPRDMVCRGLMLILHRAGRIELPPTRRTSLNPLVRRAVPAVVDIDQTPLQADLPSVGPLRFEQVRRTAQEPLFNSFLETFVEPVRHRGSCYRAANWIVLGQTSGRGHRCPTSQPNRPVKLVLGYPLVKRFRELLQESGEGSESRPTEEPTHEA